MNKYNKHYLERDPASGLILIKGGKEVGNKIIGGEPVLGKLAKEDCPLEERHVKVLNRSWKKTGIFYSPMPKKDDVETKSDARLALESEAEKLNISFRANIGDEKLQEKINEVKNAN